MKHLTTLPFLIVFLCCTLVSCEKKASSSEVKYVGSWSFSYALIDGYNYDKESFLQYLESPSQSDGKWKKEMTALANTTFTLNDNFTFKGYMPSDQAGVLFSPTGTWSVSDGKMYLNDPDQKLEWIYTVAANGMLYQSYEYYSHTYKLFYSK